VVVDVLAAPERPPIKRVHRQAQLVPLRVVHDGMRRIH
jgi:hypothetical protein